MTSLQIEIWRLAQVLDGVMAYSKGTPMVTDAQWRDIVTMIQDECPVAYDALVNRFDMDMDDTKPCLHCRQHDHAVMDCRLAQVEARAERNAREEER